MSKYGMTDSGKRQSFGKGMAIRDTADDKPRPDLISPFAEERQGHWLRMGAAKYAERNWENGMPFSRCVASLKRHVMKYQQGKRDEDHLAAIMFNAMALIHYEEMIERGRLPAELNDMPNYQPVVKTKARKPARRHAERVGGRAVVDSIVYPGLVHLNGCLMAAVDLETTGTRPGYHEIIQIAVVPLDSDFKPLADVRPFYTLVKPKHPERESEAAKQKHKIPMSELLLHAPRPTAWPTGCLTGSWP